MTKKISNFKNGIIAILLIAITLVISGMVLLTKGNKLFAYYSEEFTGLSNSNFQSTSGSSKPSTPTSWTLTTTNTPSNVKAGVIDLSEKNFEEENDENYYLSSTPSRYEGLSTDDSKVLMLNARTGKANIGYKSNTFTFNKGGYYKITVHAYTENNSNAYGTIAFDSSYLKNKVNALQVSTLGLWQDYNIYVKTNQSNSLSDCTLQLWLGSNSSSEQAGATGAVLYDNISITEFTQDKYILDYEQSLAIDTLNTHNLEIDLQSNNLDLIENADFENATLDGWTVKSNNGSNPEDENNVNGVFLLNNSDESHTKDVLKVDSYPTNGNFYNNKKALLINNSISSESIGYESSPFELEYNSVYKLTVWAKSSIKEGTAQLVLSENKYKEDDSYYDEYNNNLQTFTLDLSKSTNAKTNNWIEYNFYISTKSFTPISASDFNNNFTLGLWVGTESNPAKGYAFFDNISIHKITTQDIPDSTTNAKICNLVPDSTANIKNGTFNNINVLSTTETYPLSPKNWSVTSSNTDTTKILNGVINTNSDNFNTFKNNIQTKIGNLELSNFANLVTNPKQDELNKSNNVLMLGNLGYNYQYYESDDITISSNKYYELSVDVNTQLLDSTSAGIQLIYDSGIIGEKLNIVNTDWTTYKFYIKANNEDMSVSLRLCLGNENKTGSGFAFFDNVTLTESTEDDYNNPPSIYAYKKINLSAEDFTNISDNADEMSGFFTPYNFTFSHNITSNIDDVKKGVIKDVNKLSSYDLPENSSSNNLLAIESINTEGYLAYQSNKNYTINSDSYYEISVWIKTTSINHTEKENDENAEYGASFFLSNSNNSFTGFKGIDTNGEWKKYSIYINSTDATNYNINLSLGNENDNASGNVYFSTLTFNTIESSDDYYEAIKPLEEDSTIDNILAVGNTDKPEDTTDEDTDTDSNGFTFDFTLVASIITALAILIALIGFGIRKINFKKPVKVGKKDYDRDLLMKNLKAQEQKINNNDANLDKLKTQLDNLRTQIEDLKVEYKEKVQKIDDEYQSKVNEIDENSTNKNELILDLKLTNKQAKEDAKTSYENERKELMSNYEMIEKQVEVLYQQELELIREYKSYKKKLKTKNKKK